MENGTEQAYYDEESIRQYLTTMEFSLFLSSMGLKHGNYNYYFRQFLSRLRPDFVLPSPDFDFNDWLNLQKSEIVNKTIEVLSNKRFTLMANVIKLKKDGSKFLCLSAGFVINSRFESLLLAIYKLEADKIKKMDSLIPYVNEVIFL